MQTIKKAGIAHQQIFVASQQYDIYEFLRHE